MDIRAIDLNLLPVLDALLRRRSATLAASDLDMSQSALSSALGRLRTLTGDELFVRTGRGLRPTARAEALAEPVAEILGRVRDEFLQSASFDPASASVTFRIAHSDVGAYVLWPRIVRAVRAQAPNIGLAMRVLSQEQIGPALADGHVDLAIGTYPGLPQGLYRQRLFDRRFVAMVARCHPLADKAPTLRAFANAPQVVVRAASGVQERIDARLAAAGLQRRDCIEVPSYLMTPPLLEDGRFLAVLPGQLAEAFCRTGPFAILPLPLALPPSVISMHWHRRFGKDAGNRWLRSLVAGQLSDSHS